ncbi:MAG: helix-turn-helix transcriptional regulator [Planctomycetota bacterium]|nr:helix-turn-helix transcriptional regulator [Planctomycetota bacterium]
MPSQTSAILRMAEETLAFDFLAGEVTRVTYPHVAGWRQLPELVTAETTYTSHLRVEGRRDGMIRHGEALCVCSNVRHQIEVVPGTDGVSRWSHVKFTLLGSVDCFALLEPPFVIPRPLSKKIGDVNEELADLHASGLASLTDAIRRKALGFRLLELVASCSRPRPGGAAFLEGAQRLAPVLTHIDAHLAGDLGREALAELVHLSPTRFYAVFVETLGLAPRDYVQQKRLERAQQLLIRSDLSVKEIAAQVGHPDPFHFSRLFKQVCGASPQHYRAQLRRSLI